MKFATEHEASPGIRDRREKEITIKTEDKWEKFHSVLKALKIYQFSWKVMHTYSDSNNKN